MAGGPAIRHARGCASPTADAADPHTGANTRPDAAYGSTDAPRHAPYDTGSRLAPEASFDSTSTEAWYDTPPRSPAGLTATSHTPDPTGAACTSAPNCLPGEVPKRGKTAGCRSEARRPVATATDDGVSASAPSPSSSPSAVMRSSTNTSLDARLKATRIAAAGLQRLEQPVVCGGDTEQLVHVAQVNPRRPHRPCRVPVLAAHQVQGGVGLLRQPAARLPRGGHVAGERVIPAPVKLERLAPAQEGLHRRGVRGEQVAVAVEIASHAVRWISAWVATAQPPPPRGKQRLGRRQRGQRRRCQGTTGAQRGTDAQVPRCGHRSGKGPAGVARRARPCQDVACWRGDGFEREDLDAQQRHVDTGGGHRHGQHSQLNLAARGGVGRD
eukprot:scaffold13767_cov97-Isochrysis_galbana.AAC.2